MFTDVLKAAFYFHLAYIILVWGHLTWTHWVFVLQKKAIPKGFSGLEFMEDYRQAFGSMRITIPSQYL